MLYKIAREEPQKIEALDESCTALLTARPYLVDINLDLKLRSRFQTAKSKDGRRRSEKGHPQCHLIDARTHSYTSGLKLPEDM